LDSTPNARSYAAARGESPTASYSMVYDGSLCEAMHDPCHRRLRPRIFIMVSR
jgi:hypothetical protein